MIKLRHEKRIQNTFILSNWIQSYIQKREECKLASEKEWKNLILISNIFIDCRFWINTNHLYTLLSIVWFLQHWLNKQHASYSFVKRMFAIGAFKINITSVSHSIVHICTIALPACWTQNPNDTTHNNEKEYIAQGIALETSIRSFDKLFSMLRTICIINECITLNSTVNIQLRHTNEFNIVRL